MTDDLQQIVRHYGIVQKVVEYIFAKNLGDTEAVKKELRSLNFIEFFELQKDFNEAYLREASIWKKIQNKER